MTLTINGEEVEFAGENITDLLSKLQLDKTRVATELNREIIPKSKYSETMLNNGDKLEIISFVGGG